MKFELNTDFFSSENYTYYEDVNQGILRNIGENLKVLDVGCGVGALGKAIKDKGNNIVYGIDNSEYAINIAKVRIDRAFIGDITKIENLPEEISNNKFDLIVFADVLEHIYDPIFLLEKYKSLLNDDGHILISVPNISTWTLRLKMIFGRFNYSDTGTLDRTHIRFFTIKTIKTIVKNLGYKIEKIDITPNIIRVFLPLIIRCISSKEKFIDDPKVITDSIYYKIYIKYVIPFETFIARLCKSLMSFQIIVLAKWYRE